MADVVTGMNEHQLSQVVQTLEEKLEEMPFNMRMFSLSLRSLYVENAVGSDEKPSKEFRKLRDDTRNDAMVYLKCLLPLSTQFVRCLKMFFEYFLYLDFEEWKESLPDIKAEVAEYKAVCEAVLKGHEKILVPLKKRQDKAKMIIAEFADLQDKYEKEVAELKADADKAKKWAFGLVWIPLVNAIATPLLLNKCGSKLAEALVAKSQVEVNQRATFVVRDVLIPAIENFIQGFSAAAEFFSVIEQELQTFEEKASHEEPKKIHYKFTKRKTKLQTFEERASHEEPKKMYYNIMNREAEKMMVLCQAFYAVLPEVRTDLLAIPTKGTDKNYVDKWLEKQKKIIKEQSKIPHLLEEMMKAITDSN